MPNAPGRDLSGGLTVEKLLGGWTVVSGAEPVQAQPHLDRQDRHRPLSRLDAGLQPQGLRVVASWQLAGRQVQLFDENGDIVAALILRGNRFVGTLAGGQGISMVG